MFNEEFVLEKEGKNCIYCLAFSTKCIQPFHLFPG